MEGSTVFSEPVGEAVELAVQPRLESWEAAGHPAQIALVEYLDHVETASPRSCSGTWGVI